MNYSLEQLRSAHKKLPQNIKDAIDSVDSTEIMLDLRKKHSLTIEQMGYIADETGFAMLGLTHPKDFVGNIKSKLGVSDEIAKDITKEINDEIFAPIKDSLMKLHGSPRVDTIPPTEKVESIDDSYREPVEVAPSATSEPTTNPRYHASGYGAGNLQPTTNTEERETAGQTTNNLQPMAEATSEIPKEEVAGDKQEEEVMPSREELLKEIEGETLIATPEPAIIGEGGDLISKKLGSQTSIPSKESSQEAEVVNKDNESTSYSTEDPYREPLL